MRVLIVVISSLSLFGCTAMLRLVSPTPSPNYASLSFRSADGRPIGKIDGIRYVDGYDLPEPRQHIYVAKGRRSIGYNCPGWISVDGFVSLQYHFEAGESYEMVCEKQGPAIHLKDE